MTPKRAKPMPDISKCADSECPSRETCYRFTAPSSSVQVFADFERPKQAEKCLAHWPTLTVKKYVSGY